MTETSVQARADGLSFRQLRLFVSIGRLGSVRKASEACNLSQPAVTQSLSKLERQLGLKLVERRASGSYLNPYGQIFHRRAERFFAQVEDALSEFAVPDAENPTKVILSRIARSQVRSLIAVVDHNSFVLAARALGVSPASLLRTARDLESNLRKPLFYRTATGTTVTPAGNELGRRLKLASQEIESGISELEAAAGRFESEMVIGALPFGGSMLLAAAVEDFVRAYPTVDIRIVNESSSAMKQRLRLGDVDFVIGLQQEVGAADLAFDGFGHTPYCVVGRAGHPLAAKRDISLDDLLAYDWVVGTPGSTRRACFDRMFDSRRRPPATISTCVLTVIRALLARSDRLTLMTSFEVANEARLAAIPFGLTSPAPAIGVTTRAGWLPTRLHAEFIDMVRRHTRLPSGRPQLKQVAHA